MVSSCFGPLEFSIDFRSGSPNLIAKRLLELGKVSKQGFEFIHVEVFIAFDHENSTQSNFGQRNAFLNEVLCPKLHLMYLYRAVLFLPERD